MKTIFSLLAFGALLAACQSAPAPTTVHLQGQLVDMGTTEVTMRYDGAASLVGDSRDILLHTDADGRFDTTLTITEPTYYTISRNTLYLTPGDDLTLRITQDNRRAVFSGQGASVNTYMKRRLFPKGGSFLAGGSNLRDGFAQTKALVDSLAAVRRAQLDTLSGATEEFKRLEGARITADVVNSYMCYPAYASLRGENMSEEARDSFFLSLKDELTAAYQSLADDKLLDVAVVRDVMGSVVKPDSPLFEEIAGAVNISPRMKELYTAVGQAEKLRGEVDETLVADARALAGSLANRDFADELTALIDQASKLLKGQPAIDFTFTDVDGATHRLSDFRGKALYLDFWATWCGPCMQESPFFHKLAAKFEGKDVTFISLSTDTDRDAWLKLVNSKKESLPSYNTVDETIRSGWAIHYIPRFVLIDKDFRIVDAYAPRPSEPEAEEAINALLK